VRLTPRKGVVESIRVVMDLRPESKAVPRIEISHPRNGTVAYWLPTRLPTGAPVDDTQPPPTRRPGDSLWTAAQRKLSKG